MLDHPVRLYDGEVMITVGNFYLNVEFHGSESQDCPLRGIRDFVALDEEQFRNGKSSPSKNHSMPRHPNLTTGVSSQKPVPWL